MIYTNMGNAVERITDYDDDSEMVRFIRASDGAVRVCSLSQLKADGGIDEIHRIIYTIVSEARQDWPTVPTRMERAA